jgi:hypothetical protein
MEIALHRDNNVTFAFLRAAKIIEPGCCLSITHG